MLTIQFPAVTEAEQSPEVAPVAVSEDLYVDDLPEVKWTSCIPVAAVVIAFATTIFVTAQCTLVQKPVTTFN